MTESITEVLQKPSDKTDNNWNDTILYDEIYEFLKAHIYLPNTPLYHALTCQILVGRRINQFETIAYAAFIGPPDSGKSRGLDVISVLAKNALEVATITPSALFHAIDSKQHDWVCIDEYDLVSDESRDAVNQLLNCGYSRGRKAIRMVPQKNGEHSLGYFDVFGVKAIASLKEPAPTILSRCVRYQMSRAPKGIIAFDLDKLKAEVIKAQLAHYEERHRENPTEKPFNPEEWGSNRLAQLFRPLFQVAPTDEAVTMLKLLCDTMDQQQHSREQQSWIGQLVQVIQEMIGEQMILTKNNIVIVKTLEILPRMKAKITIDSAYQAEKYGRYQVARDLRNLQFHPEHTEKGEVWALDLNGWNEQVQRWGIPSAASAKTPPLPTT